MQSATTRFKNRIELHAQAQPLVAKHIGGTNSRMKRPQPHPSHRRGTFHRRLQPLYTEKPQGFVLRLPPHKIAHATFMQPFQCDPQPEIQETHRTTQTDTTTRCKTHRRNQFAHETTPAAPAAHTRYLSSSPAATLHGKTQGFVLRLPPHKIAHATLHAAIPMQFCNQRFKNRIELHSTDTTTCCKTHRRKPIRAWNDPSRTRRTHEVPFIVACSHFIRKKHKVSCSGFLPTR